MKRILKTIWYVIRQMGTLKGIISFVIVWLLISGSGMILLGWILAIKWLISTGLIIYGVWLLPFTPLIPITIILGMLFQRYVLFDKNISIKKIKAKWKELKK